MFLRPLTNYNLYEHTFLVIKEMRIQPEDNAHHYNGGYKPKNKTGAEKYHDRDFMIKAGSPRTGLPTVKTKTNSNYFLATVVPLSASIHPLIKL